MGYLVSEGRRIQPKTSASSVSTFFVRAKHPVPSPNNLANQHIQHTLQRDALSLVSLQRLSRLPQFSFHPLEVLEGVPRVRVRQW